MLIPLTSSVWDLPRELGLLHIRFAWLLDTPYNLFGGQRERAECRDMPGSLHSWLLRTESLFILKDHEALQSEPQTTLGDIIKPIPEQEPTHLRHWER